jgi:predicted GIY-YIG superfamily endonuclease
VSEHKSKIGAKSLRGKIPVKLVYFERAENQVRASKREREIKGWNKKKLKLILGLP